MRRRLPGGLHRPEGMILLTGGSGFFGIHLTRRLLAAGQKVRILDTAEIEDDEI